MAVKNVHQRLAEAMGAVSYIQNEQKKGMQYRIVSHDKVTAKVRPALLDAGIVYYPVKCEYSQNGNRTEVEIVVRFANIDKPDDFIDVPSLGFGVDPQDKGPGKAMSYAVKYALLKAMGLETGEDADLDDNRKTETENPDATEKEPDAPEHGRDNYDAIAARDSLFDAYSFCKTKQQVEGMSKAVKKSVAALYRHDLGLFAEVKAMRDKMMRDLPNEPEQKSTDAA